LALFIALPFQDADTDPADTSQFVFPSGVFFFISRRRFIYEHFFFASTALMIFPCSSDTNSRLPAVGSNQKFANATKRSEASFALDTATTTTIIIIIILIFIVIKMARQKFQLIKRRKNQ